MIHMNDRARSLGQVFTSDSVAEFMVSLIRPYLHPSSRCLDPCIGQNVFFRKMDDIDIRELIGVEIDETVISDETKRFYARQGRRLIVGDFFDIELEGKFDAVIMNPPYVRQEDIEISQGQKNKLRKSVAGVDMRIPSNANLYVYFLVKALHLLKTNGVLVAEMACTAMLY